MITISPIPTGAMYAPLGVRATGKHADWLTIAVIAILVTSALVLLVKARQVS